jgi:hypothetical protein
MRSYLVHTIKFHSFHGKGLTGAGIPVISIVWGGMLQGTAETAAIAKEVIERREPKIIFLVRFFRRGRKEGRRGTKGNKKKKKKKREIFNISVFCLNIKVCLEWGMNVLHAFFVLNSH